MAGARSPAPPGHRRPPGANTIWSGAGADGTPGTPADIVGSEAAKTGIYALLDVDLFNLLLIPETFDMSSAQAAAVIPQAITLCEQRRAFYIVDAPSALDF